MRFYFRLFLLFFGLVCPLYLSAMTDSAHINIDLIQEEKTIQPERSFWVALRLDIEKGWHVYWKNPGDAGLPLKVEWKLPPGFTAGEIKWPFPERFTFDDMVGFGYHDEVILLAEINPPSSIQPGSQIQLDGEVKWLVCSAETCQPGSAPFHLSSLVETTSPQINSSTANIFKEARQRLPQSKVKVKTIRKEGIVQLQVPVSESDWKSVTGVYFFPEQKDVIDHAVEPMVAINSSSTSYLVNLKGSDEIGVKKETLKGVLVIQTKNSDEIQAFDIESPIQDHEGNGLLSFVDAQTSSAQFVPGSSIGNHSLTVPARPTFEGGVGLAIVFAFLGGMILNLMPCVLPVISFKVMSFMKMAGQSRSLTIKHGLVFCMGVILSFWVLATSMLVLRAYGQAVGWGFQLQEPLFVAILASLLFIFSLSLFGVFEWGLVVASWAGQTEAAKSQRSVGYTSSFFSGVMATAVATPCTGPFLGSAVGFAVTLPMFQALLIFTSLGLGMCFPYLLLAAFPSCLRFMPKPGAWMETFKQLMGFLLLATVLWLLWVFSAQTNSLSLIYMLAGFLCFAIGAWMYGRGCSLNVKKSKRVLSYAIVGLMAIAGIQLIISPRSSWYKEDGVSQKGHEDEWLGWETFSPERVAELQKQGKPILIDFTAKWCLICQANHMVLSNQEISKRLDEAGVVKMKADWTRNDPVITQELSKFGRTSVPLYVFYGSDATQNPVIMPQVLTKEAVLNHVQSVLDTQEIALR